MNMKLDFAFHQDNFAKHLPVGAADEPANTTVSTRPRRDTPIPVKGAAKHVLLRDAKPFQPNFKPNVLRRETDGGFCISISLEWVCDCVMGRIFDAGIAPFRAISHQRAFIMAYESHMAGVPNQSTKSVKEMIGIDQQITNKYITRYMHSDPIKFDFRLGLKLGQLADSIVNLPLGRALLIALSGKVTGHAVAVAHGMSLFRYFDANQGQFSNEATQGAHAFAESVADNIAKKYFTLQESIDTYECYRG
jgi:hypothetical protein